MTNFKQSGYDHKSYRNYRGATPADFGDALDIETACRAVNRIIARSRFERAEARDAENKRKITLSSAYDAWLKKEMPK